MCGDGGARPGGAPVGYLSDLDAVGAGAVLCLRRWCGGTAAQAAIAEEFAAALGPDAGRRTAETFGEICSLCIRYGRRPLMRHDLRCTLVGADEACFARFVASASEGAREDAMMIATIIVRADVAPALAALAERFGLSLRRMALGAGSAPGSRALH